MPPKNRRKSNAQASDQDVKKQKKATTNDDELVEFFTQTITKVKELKDKSKYTISIDFLELPDKKIYPDYYKEIKTPVSIHEIELKIHDYSSVLEFLNDFQLMNTNAQTFNESDSIIALNAAKIVNLVKKEVDNYEANYKIKQETPAKPTHAPLPKIKLRVGGSRISTPVKQLESPTIPTPSRSQSPSSPPTLKQSYINIIDELINFEENGVKLSDPFLEEVNRKDYPDYYKVIKQAMSLTTVKKNISLGKYKNLESYIRHVKLIWKNAQSYNEEGSLIYQDSKTLEELFDKRIEELKEEREREREQSNSIKLDEVENGDDFKGDDTEENITSLSTTPSNVSLIGDFSNDNTPLRKKIGRPKGRPPKSRLNIVEKSEDLDNANEFENNRIRELKQLQQHQQQQQQLLIRDPSPIVQQRKKDKSLFNVVENEFEPSLIDVSNLQKITNKSLESTSSSFVQEFTISSSRSFYKQSLKSTPIPNQPTHTYFQNWFEYRFGPTKSISKAYSITLPSQQSAVSVSAGLNDSLVKRKHLATLTVNGEKVNPTPSIHYADTGRQLTSRYELKLPTGLNLVIFDIVVESQSNEDTRLRNGEDLNNVDVEKLTFWVQVL